MIDLTHKLNNKISIYPGTVGPVIESSANISENGYAELSISMRSHAGTHIDAPAHIVPNAKTLDQILIENFIGKGIVIDCAGKVSINLDFLLTMKDKIEESEFILFYTGWQHKWETPDYIGDYPTLTIDAIEWLLKFKPKALGFDVISVDKIGSTELPNHNLLLKNEVLVIENLTNLDKLIGKQFEMNCIPLKIEGADGSPVRAFARIITE
jgi:kynurenine formamidase